jgi:hypothetical protein
MRVRPSGVAVMPLARERIIRADDVERLARVADLKELVERRWDALQGPAQARLLGSC